VLVVLADHWPRALLRAALREAGYDAVGVRDLVEALAQPATAPDRGPVRLIILDQRVLRDPEDVLLVRLLGRHGHPAMVLLAEATRSPVGGPWRLVIQRPVSIGDVVAAARALLPLPPGAARPLD
jgi:DNA-binding response OmpR family regulator